MNGKFFITTNLLMLVLFFGFAPANGEQLRRYAPQTEVFEPDASHIFYAPDVPKTIVKMLAEFPSEKLKSEIYPSIYKMPLSENLYLVAVARNNELESEYILFRNEGGKLIETERSQKVENTIVNTTFFIGKTRVLIIADAAIPPDFSGLETFEFSNKKLKYLGSLAIAEQKKPAGVDGDFVSPTSQAAEYKLDTYFVTFKGMLFSDWNSNGGKKINAPVTFRYDGKKFQVVKKRRKFGAFINRRVRHHTKFYA